MVFFFMLCLIVIEGNDVFDFPSLLTALQLFVSEPAWPLNSALVSGFRLWSRISCGIIVWRVFCAHMVSSCSVYLVFVISSLFFFSNGVSVSFWTILWPWGSFLLSLSFHRFPYCVVLYHTRLVCIVTLKKNIWWVALLKDEILSGGFLLVPDSLLFCRWIR